MKLLPSLKQMEYLTALAETRHFGKAAELCSVTPSTLSAGIREMEDLLGVALAERTKRVVVMTDVGLRIAERARGVIRDAEDIMDLV
jgi:LysR family hydrogen peroxide-inducible transcriptional activator